jgi:hypothetical protein
VVAGSAGGEQKKSATEPALTTRIGSGGRIWYLLATIPRPTRAQ